MFDSFFISLTFQKSYGWVNKYVLSVHTWFLDNNLICKHHLFDEPNRISFLHLVVPCQIQQDLTDSYQLHLFNPWPIFFSSKTSFTYYQSFLLPTTQSVEVLCDTLQKVAYLSFCSSLTVSRLVQIGLMSFLILCTVVYYHNTQIKLKFQQNPTSSNE